MKKLKPFFGRAHLVIVTAFLLMMSNNTYAQLCGGSGCATTNYANFGFNSNNNAASIEYDNFVSSYHSTSVRTGDGKFLVWGANSKADGTDNYSPSEINATNYPLIGTSTPLKVTIGSYGIPDVLFTLLTTNGLYTWGVKNTSQLIPLQKETLNGNGLPPGVNPSDVKVLTGAQNTLAILTCSGDVWIKTTFSENAGAGSSSGLGWNRVTTNSAGDPLQNVIALRLAYSTVFALKSDGTLWTWGLLAYKGDGSTPVAIDRAIEMPRPNSSGTIKMIGITNHFSGSTLSYPTYYVLYTDGNLYSLGYNGYKQLGNWVSGSSLTWVQPRYTSGGQVMNDVKWISASDHDYYLPGINVINNNGTLYNWGSNVGSKLGRGTSAAGFDPGIPGGLTASDKILTVNTGGHTTMAIKLNEAKMGYVGHFASGSAGNGSTADNTYSTFQFVDTIIKICGTQTPLVQDISDCGPLNLAKGIQSTNETPSDGVIRWFNGNNPATATQITNTTAVAPGTYYAFYYYAATTGYSPASAPVIVSYAGTAGNVAPTIGNANISNICPASTANLGSSSPGTAPSGSSLVWFTNNAHTGTALSASQAASAGAGTYYAFFKDNTIADCYSPASNAVTVTINACPSPSISSISPAAQSVCQGVSPATITVSATGTGTLTYQWYSNTDGSSTTGTLISGATSASYTPSSSTVGTTYYAVVVTNANGSTRSSNATVNVTLRPAAPAVSSTTLSNVCPAATANLTGLQPAAVGGQTYEWHTSASNPNSGTLVASPSAVSAGTYYLYSKATAGGCYSPASNAVTVTITICCNAGTAQVSLNGNTLNN